VIDVADKDDLQPAITVGVQAGPSQITSVRGEV
jgi:hypothetical protein